MSDFSNTNRLDHLEEENAALRAELFQKRAILESSVDFAIVATDPAGKVTDWNVGAERCFGWTAQEMCGETAERFFTPEDNAKDRVGVEMRLALEYGRAGDERWHRRKDGTRFWASGEMMPLKNVNGNHIGFLKVVRDRTHEHEARLVFQEVEASLKRAQEVGGVGVFSVDDDGLLRGSPMFMRIFGLPEQGTIPSYEVEKLIISDDAHLVSNATSRAAGRVATNVVYRIHRADSGELRWIERRGDLERDTDGNVVRFVGTVRDVTAERATQELLRESERQARAFANERDFIGRLTSQQRALNDPDTVMRLSAQALGERLGANRVGFYRLNSCNQIHYSPGWNDGAMPSLVGAYPTDQFGERVEHQRRIGETLIFSDSRADPYGGLEPFARAGVISGICLSIRDGNHWRGGLYVHHTVARFWTQAEAALAREVAELTWLAVERAEAIIQMQGHIGHQEETIGRVAVELREHADQRAAAENQLRQLQKMEAVGQLTGGIAHDFNNMLAVIIGSLNLMQRRLARGETDVARFVDAAMDGATRAATLTHRLLAFSRQAALTPEPVDANHLISNLSELLSRTLGEMVQLEIAPGPDLWKTKADTNQFENLLINLAVNARDAMPDGGTLTIQTSNKYVDQDHAKKADMQVGQYVVICVSDSGLGMTPEVMARAFDPFFTTKPVGKGTGLGLSQAYGFVRQSGGYLKINSEVGLGTTFVIYLPRSFEKDADQLRRDARQTVFNGQPHEIIMVAEDEPRVRDFAVEALRELGYTVIHASTGAEALEKIRGGQDVSLLLTDIVMPEMTGRQLAYRVRELLPQIKVVYMTGYSREGDISANEQKSETNILPKPFSLDQLAKAIRLELSTSTRHIPDTNENLR